MEDQICTGLQVSTEIVLIVLILKITTSENTKNK